MQSPSNRDAASRRRAWLSRQREAQHPLRVGIRRLTRRLLRLPPWLLVGLFLAGLVLRLFVRDRGGVLLSYLYYGMQPAVLALLALAAGLWWTIARRWRYAVPAVAAGAACFVWTYATAWQHHAPVPAGPQTRRLLVWNIARGALGWDRIADRIRAADADIVVLAESQAPLGHVGGDPNEARRIAMAQRKDFWRRRLPEYGSRASPAGLTVLTRHEAVTDDSGILAGDWFTAFGHYLHAELRIAGRPLHVIAVDVSNTPRAPRHAALGALAQMVDGLAARERKDEAPGKGEDKAPALANDGEDRAPALPSPATTAGRVPILVAGDFNTPPDAPAMDLLRTRLASAFEIAGRGYNATWPAWLPLLALDQVWFSPGIHVGRCDILGAGASDHRPVIVEFTLD